MRGNKRHIKAVLLALMVSTGSVFAQTAKQKQKITSAYNSKKLNELNVKFSDQRKEKKEEALRIAALRGWDVRSYNPDGTFDELMEISPTGEPVYYTIYNVDAATSTRTNYLHTGGGLGLTVDGYNMTAHVWDGGPVRTTHQEFDGAGGTDRVTINDGVTTIDDNSFHAQHVTGTIVASGYVAAAKGMAPEAMALTHEWNNDLSEATTEAANGMLVSNHSYGYSVRNPYTGEAWLPSYYFGGYIDDSRDWDELMYNAPYYLMVVAAGNDGADDTANGDPLDGYGSYDKLTGHSTSKNNLVVASAQDASIASDGSLSSVSISTFSSEGPTDDLRIKPDLAGNGQDVYSTYDGSDSEYNSISGTSMASPNVTGSLLLLQQHYSEVNGGFMRAATLKGLALHTADDAGSTGPDAIFGWGLLNAKTAAETISNEGNGTQIEELTLSSGASYSITVDSDGSSPLMASISWTDPAGTVNTGTANLSTPVLVNDLDIEVTQGSSSYSPYLLTGVTTNGTGDNTVDPFERVDIASASGSYTITVTHKGTLSGGSQDYSLIISGVYSTPVVCSATTPTGVSTVSVGTTSASLSWDQVAGATYEVAYGPVGGSTSTLAVSGTSVTLSGLSGDTSYEVAVRSICSDDGSTSSYSGTVSFTTGSTNCSGGTSSFPYTESFENTTGTWLQSSSDDLDWTVYSGETPSSGTGPLGASDGSYYIYMEVSTDGTGYPSKQAILTSSCFDLSGETNATVTFDYQMTGSSVGSLALEASGDNGGTWNSLWSVSDDQGADWAEANISLGSYVGGTLLLRFNGLSSDSWQGDIAVDNFVLTGSSAADTEAPTAPANLSASNVTETTLTLSWSASTDNVGVVSYDVYQGTSLLGSITGTSADISGLTANTSYSFSVVAVDAAGNESAAATVSVTTSGGSGTGCTASESLPYAEGFESGDGWTQAASDDGDWVRNSSSTPSSNTGPSSAAEGSYYMFLEASTNGSTGQIGNNATAILESGCFDLSAQTEAYFSFQYHMYGSSMGSLAVQASADGTTWVELWSLSGNQGDAWTEVSLDLVSYLGGTVQLQIVGTTGDGWASDLAIDDLALTTDSGGGDDGGGGSSATVTLDFVFDNYPEETSWEILSGSSVVASGGTYGSQADGSSLSVDISLGAGCYDFVIYDAYGDGICCSYGSGSYSLSEGSTTLASGGSFGSSETTSFCVGGATNVAYSIATTSVGQPASFDIYPNPVVGQVLNVVSTRENLTFSISNVMGQIVSHGQLNSMADQIDVSTLSDGIYMLQLGSGTKSVYRKFIKE